MARPGRKRPKFRYYGDDTEQRKAYWDAKVTSAFKILADNNNVALSKLMNEIKNFEDFKEKLEIAFASDKSISEYLNGMSQVELRELYNRDTVQELIDVTEDNEEEITEKIPLEVIQDKNETREFFRASVKGKRTMAYKDEVIVQGKTQVRYRDSKGRFTKRL